MEIKYKSEITCPDIGLQKNCNYPSLIKIQCFFKKNTKTRLKYLIFDPMKNRIYTISLLLSFLVVLSHELIAHHHHEDLALNFSVMNEHDDEHNNEKHHQHDSQDEEDNSGHNHHSFPPHYHISATNNFDYTRTTILGPNFQVRDISSFIVAHLFFINPSKPPNLVNNPYIELNFLISSLFNPDANALRGPPSIV
jgi:hypothetical protein